MYNVHASSLVPRLSPCTIIRPLTKLRSFAQFSMNQRLNDRTRGEPGDEANVNIHAHVAPLHMPVDIT